MFRRLTVAIALAALAALTTRAARAQDVMTVAKDHYKVLIENQHVRVIENVLAPGEKDALHTHPAGWYYVTRPGAMRVVFANGKSELWKPRAGEAGWSPAEGAHTSENVGSAPMSYILVEVKSATTATANAASTASRSR